MPTEPQVAISKEASRQILRDIENNKGVPSVILLAKRPKHYLGCYQKSAQNRYNYLVRLKKEKPARYLLLKEQYGDEDELVGKEGNGEQLDKEEKHDNLKVPSTPISSPSLNRQKNLWLLLIIDLYPHLSLTLHERILQLTI